MRRKKRRYRLNNRGKALVALLCAFGILGLTSFTDKSPSRNEEIIPTFEPLALILPVSTVSITTPPIEPEIEPEPPEPSYSDHELLILSIIIYQEAGGDACSDETRLMVGNVFLNRVADDRFPDTFEEVALQSGQYGTLWKTGLQWPARASQEIEQPAVERAYETARILLEGERILPNDIIWQAEFEQGKETYIYKDKIYFCR